MLLLGLALGTQALEDVCEANPADQTQRRWQRQLLCVLRWALPAGSLDPDADGAGEREMVREGEGLLSPPIPSSPRPLPTHPRSPAAAEQQAAVALDAAELYAAVKPSGREAELAVPTPELRPELRCYQKRAAQWMLTRERGIGSGEGRGAEAAEDTGGGAALTAKARGRAWGGVAGPRSHQEQAQQEARQVPLHPLWREVACSGSGAAFYVNPHTGRLALRRFDVEEGVRGGMLCDEMGLGKTVELLACIVANKFRGPKPIFSKADEGR